MKNKNNYALFYKKDKKDRWHSERPDMPVQLWEYYANKQGYAKFDIRNFKEDDAWHLHLTTDVVRFNRKYYLPEEEIPYPEKAPKNNVKFEINLQWEEENDFFEADYKQIYKGYTHDEIFSTVISASFLANQKRREVIIAQDFIDYFNNFLEELKQKKHAVFSNNEISAFKWLCWLKDDKVRLIHQDYNGQNVKTIFDILTDKDLFFNECEKMLKEMQEYVKKDLKRYQDYVLKKYGKLLENSVPYPETEPLKLDSLDITIDVKNNDDSDFEYFFEHEESLCTTVYAYLKTGDKTEEIVFIAEDYAKYFSSFIGSLKEIENAVHDDYEYTCTIWNAWIKDDIVRLVYDDFSSDTRETIFDIAVDKNLFFETAEKLKIQMEEIAEKERSRYKEYIKKNNKKTTEELFRQLPFASQKRIRDMIKAEIEERGESNEN